MRRKHLICIVLVGCIIPLVFYFALTQKYLLFKAKPQRLITIGKVTPALREEIHLEPLNPNLLSPLISNPMNQNQNLQSPITVKSVVLEPAKKNLRSEFKDTDVSYNVHAFYYPWYGSLEVNGAWSHWNHETIPHWQPSINAQYPKRVHEPPDDIAARFYPALGAYSSSDPKVIHEHMKQLRKAGIGVLAVSWYPPETRDPNALLFVDDLMPILLDIANEYAIKLCFHIEPYKDRSASTVRRDLIYIIDKYGKHPSFYRYNNLPLVYIYDSYLTPGKEWATIFQPQGESTIRGTPYDVVAIGLFVERDHCESLHEGGFNGFYTYFAAQGFVYGSRISNWNTMKQCTKSLQEPRLFIPSVGPGYNDSPVRPWNGVNTHARREGAYYEEMWREAINIHSEIVSVTSFNEWHEGSQIESAVKKEGYEDYGNDPDFYLKLTRKMIQKM